MPGMFFPESIYSYHIRGYFHKSIFAQANIFSKFNPKRISRFFWAAKQKLCLADLMRMFFRICCFLIGGIWTAQTSGLVNLFIITLLKLNATNWRVFIWLICCLFSVIGNLLTNAWIFKLKVSSAWRCFNYLTFTFPHIQDDCFLLCVWKRWCFIKTVIKGIPWHLVLHVSCQKIQFRR